ncbi:MAG: hypothetical protein JNM02_03290 [Anaerolineales bacterium]|nr:hypothetical protein [Anaerolineales bacterium]
MKPETLRNIFLVIFVASSTVLFFAILGPRIGNVFSEINSSLAVGTQSPGDTPSTGTEEHPMPGLPSIKSDSITLFGSIIASATSLVGFVTTTVITWRKERREASLADMERKRLETELEKSRLELEKLKKGNKKKEVKKKRK